eukprot:6191585-Pleurochrysis_carterae.AAC.3
MLDEKRHISIVTGCSSRWDELRTLTNTLGSAITKIAKRVPGVQVRAHDLEPMAWTASRAKLCNTRNGSLPVAYAVASGSNHFTCERRQRSNAEFSQFFGHSRSNGAGKMFTKHTREMHSADDYGNTDDLPPQHTGNSSSSLYYAVAGIKNYMEMKKSKTYSALNCGFEALEKVGIFLVELLARRFEVVDRPATSASKARPRVQAKLVPACNTLVRTLPMSARARALERWSKASPHVRACSQTRLIIRRRARATNGLQRLHALKYASKDPRCHRSHVHTRTRHRHADTQLQRGLHARRGILSVKADKCAGGLRLCEHSFAHYHANDSTCASAHTTTGPSSLKAGRKEQAWRGRRAKRKEPRASQMLGNGGNS